DPAAQLRVALELAVGECELLEHPEREGVASGGTVQPHEQDVPAPLDRDRRLLVHLTPPGRSCCVATGIIGLAFRAMSSTTEAAAAGTFEQATAVTPVDEGRFRAQVDPGWSTPIAANGGYL